MVYNAPNTRTILLVWILLSPFYIEGVYYESIMHGTFISVCWSAVQSYIKESFKLKSKTLKLIYIHLQLDKGKPCIRQVLYNNPSRRRRHRHHCCYSR